VPLGCWCPASSAQPCRELEGNLSCSFFFSFRAIPSYVTCFRAIRA
jgi:hypothetical protein